MDGLIRSQNQQNFKLVVTGLNLSISKTKIGKSFGLDNTMNLIIVNLILKIFQCERVIFNIKKNRSNCNNKLYRRMGKLENDKN